jgi:predicted AAA+ superfamily ATPase
LFVIDPLPAWSSNRLKRPSRTPKRVVADTGVLAALLDADASTLLADGGLMGQLIESFVITQLRSDVEFCNSRPRLYHLRDRDSRHEVDVIVEYGVDRLAGIEVKAAAAVELSDARHLVWLRDQLGSRFVAGVVLHTGPRAFRIDDGIIAAPIAVLWG